MKEGIYFCIQFPPDPTGMRTLLENQLIKLRKVLYNLENSHSPQMQRRCYKNTNILAKKTKIVTVPSKKGFFFKKKAAHNKIPILLHFFFVFVCFCLFVCLFVCFFVKKAAHCKIPIPLHFVVVIKLLALSLYAALCRCNFANNRVYVERFQQIQIEN